MPVIDVDMYICRSQREKDRLAETITEDVVKILRIGKDDVIVVFHVTPHGNWYASGVVYERLM